MRPSFLPFTCHKTLCIEGLGIVWWRNLCFRKTQEPAFFEWGKCHAMPTLERLTVLLYSCSSNALTINACRRALLPRQGYQQYHYSWSSIMETCAQSSILCRPPMESVTDDNSSTATAKEMGLEVDSRQLIPDWTDLPEELSVVRDLIKCRCNPEKGSHWRCKCVNALLPCTELCMRKGECKRDD